MPNKTPQFWESILAIFSEYGFVMCITFILSYLRISYENKRHSLASRLLESTIGSLLALIAGLTFEKLGWSEGWTYGAVGFIGVFGVSQIKEWGRKWAENKIKDRPEYDHHYRDRFREEDDEL